VAQKAPLGESRKQNLSEDKMLFIYKNISIHGELLKLCWVSRCKNSSLIFQQQDEQRFWFSDREFHY